MKLVFTPFLLYFTWWRTYCRYVHLTSPLLIIIMLFCFLFLLQKIIINTKQTLPCSYCFLWLSVLYLCICGCTSLPYPEKPEYYQHRCLIPYHSKEKLSEIQWAAFILLCAGCTIAQLNPSSDHVLQTPIQGWMMAIVRALLSGFAGVYTEVS